MAIDPARKAHVHVVRANDVNGQPLKTGDAAMIQDEAAVALAAGHAAEVWCST